MIFKAGWTVRNLFAQKANAVFDHVQLAFGRILEHLETLLALEHVHFVSLLFVFVEYRCSGKGLLALFTSKKSSFFWLFCFQIFRGLAMAVLIFGFDGLVVHIFFVRDL